MTPGLLFSAVRLYEEKRHLSLGIHIPGFPAPIIGLVFAYQPSSGVALMLRERELGRIHWQAEGVAFDPPLPGGRQPLVIRDFDLDEWVGLAYRRSLLAPRSDQIDIGLKPGQPAKPESQPLNRPAA